MEKPGVLTTLVFELFLAWLISPVTTAQRQAEPEALRAHCIRLQAVRCRRDAHFCLPKNMLRSHTLYC